MSFELLWRRTGQADVPIVTFEHQYPPGEFAQYEETRRGERVPSQAGDLLVFRASLVGGNPQDTAVYVPVSEHPSTPTSRMLSIGLP